MPIAVVPRGRLVVAWATYEATHLPTLAPKSRAEYRACIRRAVAELPELLDVAAVLRWRAGLLGRYSIPYCNQIVHVLRTVTRRAAIITGDAELASIAWQVAPVREYTRAPRCPPRDLLARSLLACRSDAERLFVALAGLAGLRRGELMGLKACDFEASTSTLRVVRQRLAPHRKNHRPHAVVLDAPRIVDLWARVASQSAGGELRSRSGWHRGKSEGFLFPWGLRRVAGLLARLRGCLGGGYLPKGLGWHAYRHWGASELARRGASVWDVQRWLGDSDPTMAVLYVDLVRGASASSISTLAPMMVYESTPAGVQPPAGVECSGRKPAMRISRTGKPEAANGRKVSGHVNIRSRPRTARAT